MIDLNRRRLLQTASIVVGNACVGRLLADDAAAPPVFAEKPSFEPLAVFLTWQRDPTTTMTVHWIGSRDDGAKRPIWFSKEGSLQWQSAASAARAFPLSDHQIYRTELSGLEPGGHYRFRIGADGAERRFRTMPARATDTIEFVSGGDAGIGEAAEHTNAVAAAQDPMFAVIGGDLAYENGKDAKTFLKFLQNYARQMVDGQGRLIPWVACIGNHEVDGGYGKPRSAAPFFYSVFDGLFPETGYGALDFGDYLSLVLLDTNHTTPVAGEQTSWLEGQLKERQDRPSLFVCYHVPSYPSFRPFDLDNDEGSTGADSRKYWCPLFERYGVDAVFEHHDHTFKRTHPLVDGRADPNGVPYIGDGSWGKLRRPKTTAERPYLAVAKESYHLS
ncbi:MAG TPA: metallophosphoesterase family protein, partial [Pirellulales bacterium]|nr:metallophosphoesterase family protein [Pirellulales bacterium]